MPKPRFGYDEEERPTGIKSGTKKKTRRRRRRLTDIDNKRIKLPSSEKTRKLYKIIAVR